MSRVRTMLLVPEAQEVAALGSALTMGSRAVKSSQVTTPAAFQLDQTYPPPRLDMSSGHPSSLLGAPALLP